MPRRLDDPSAADDSQVDASENAASPSGRVRHEEKITVYVTSEELIELERARLALRADHGLAVDRGRIVRAAVGLAMADLAANGDDSALVRRLLAS